MEFNGEDSYNLQIAAYEVGMAPTQYMRSLFRDNGYVIDTRFTIDSISNLIASVTQAEKEIRSNSRQIFSQERIYKAQIDEISRNIKNMYTALLVMIDKVMKNEDGNIKKIR